MPDNLTDHRHSNTVRDLDALGGAAAQARAVGVSAAPILVSAIGPEIAVLVSKLGRRDVAQALHEMAQAVDGPKRAIQ